MELLYVWINKSENGVFEEHGINLSPEYNFLVNRLDNGVVLSEDASWHKTESIFKSDTIVNVTAVVGKNGAGKTTLLKFLYNMHNQIGGMRAGSERNPFLDKNQMIVIAKINEVPMVFYNICNENFTNTTQYHTSINLKENIFESSFTYYEEVKSFYDVFRLFFTNSNYSIDKKSFIGVQGELSQLSLSDSEMYSISSSFFRKVLDLNHSIDFFSPGWYLNWRNDYLYREYALLDFQKICDIIYYFKLLNEGSFENYLGKKSSSIFLGVKKIIRIIDSQHRGFYRKYVDGETDNHFLFMYYSQLRTLFDSVDHLSPDKYLICSLCIILMFEYCIDKGIEMPVGEGLIEDEIDWLVNTFKNPDDYFLNAVEEIKELESYVLNSEVPDNGGMPRDIPGYMDYIVIDYDNHQENYRGFTGFIDNLFRKDTCFLLRYLVFDNMGMSTGERAFQNLFTRINLIPQLNTVISKDLQYSDNLLLIIDEIDLYLHPEWQQNFISLMLSEIEKQFQSKRVQIVFSTHSPLLLSDIPRENTVYLRDNHDRRIVDSRESHQQSFGRDIYSLLKDSFYLESYSMGSYAMDYINQIIAIMSQAEQNNSCFELRGIEELEQKIKLIGNEVIRQKLKTMLSKFSRDSKEYRLKLLIEQKEELERQIEEMRH